MTQRQLDRAVAIATGKSAFTISRMGFCPLTQISLETEQKPRIVNWDRLDARRTGYLPQRSRQRMAAA